MGQKSRLGEADSGVHIGIMGGTFDPIHIAHLICAEAAYSQSAFDEVLFIPAGVPSFKQGATCASPNERLAMCELATADNNHFKVSDIEVRREGITYTVDTVCELKGKLGDGARLTFIIGSDAYLTLLQWRCADELCRMVDFAVIVRSGDDAEQVRAYARSLEVDFGTHTTLVLAPSMDISSHKIREMVKEGRSIRYLVPKAVMDYINEKGLYR